MTKNLDLSPTARRGANRPSCPSPSEPALPPLHHARALPNRRINPTILRQDNSLDLTETSLFKFIYVPIAPDSFAGDRPPTPPHLRRLLPSFPRKRTAPHYELIDSAPSPGISPASRPCSLAPKNTFSDRNPDLIEVCCRAPVYHLLLPSPLPFCNVLDASGERGGGGGITVLQTGRWSQS